MKSQNFRESLRSKLVVNPGLASVVEEELAEFKKNPPTLAETALPVTLTLPVKSWQHIIYALTGAQSPNRDETEALLTTIAEAVADEVTEKRQ